MGHTDVSGYDLHAFVDGELARALRRATARLAAGRPESVALHRLPAPDGKRATRRR